MTEQEFIAQYRRANPRSRATGVLVFCKNTSATKQRECLLCGWKGPTWAASYPQTKRAREAEAEHVASHFAKDLPMSERRFTVQDENADVVAGLKDMPGNSAALTGNGRIHYDRQLEDLQVDEIAHGKFRNEQYVTFRTR